MSKENKWARRILITVAVSSICVFMGPIFHIEIVKYVSGLALAYSLGLSIMVISKLKSNLKSFNARLVLLILTIYPITRVIYDCITNTTVDSSRFFSDGLIVQGSYYELILVGLAMALLLKRIDGYQLISDLAIYALLIGVVIMIVSITIPLQAQRIVVGHIAIINCFIPVALLALNPVKKGSVVMGWIAIGLIIFLSIKIYSRSYSLVGIYLAVFATMGFFYTGKKKIGIRVLLIISVVTIFGAPAFFSQKSALGAGDQTVLDKYQFGSLGKSLDRFSEDGDFVRLFFWEGNSRAGILVDAFKNFDTTEWMFGRGIFGTYVSFETRTTIELDWAEELFRWGIGYTLFFIALIIYVRRRIKRGKYFRYNNLFIPLSGLLIIRLLDGFVFGLPQNSLYSLFFFTGLMSICVNYREKRSTQVQITT